MGVSLLYNPLTDEFEAVADDSADKKEKNVPQPEIFFPHEESGRRPLKKFNFETGEFSYADDNLQKIHEARKQQRSTNRDRLTDKQRLMEQGLEEIGLTKKDLGKTADPKTGQISDIHRQTAASQIEDAKEKMEQALPMSVKDFSDLLNLCKLYPTEESRVSFCPVSPKDKEHIEDIIRRNGLKNISLTDFNAISKKLHPLYRTRQKLKQQKLAQYAALSPEQAAELPMEQKLEYMELLFPRQQTRKGLLEVCQQNEPNIKACLFTMDFPKNFWQREKELAERYASLIASSPEMTDKLKNWEQTSLDEKKAVIFKAAEIFEYVYDTPLKIGFFTPEEMRDLNKKQGLNPDTHINAAFYCNGCIFFNTERLQQSDNFFAVSVPLHEGMHLRQDSHDFQDETVNRLFAVDISRVSLYEDEINNKSSAAYKDLYAMSPGEKHAHGIQLYMEERLTEKTGLAKSTDREPDREVENIHNKAFTMAKITQSRS